MQLTIIYDNTTQNEALAPDWGFACRVEAHGRTILFDTGAKGSLLLDNMKKLGMNPGSFDEIFISHDHWDHTGGLADFLALNPVSCFIPEAFTTPAGPSPIRIGTAAQQIHDGIWSTGTLAGIEHSLVIAEKDKVIVVAGCSHPGVESILEAAGRIGRVSALIGGLHGFNRLQALRGLDLVCPTHCTQHIREIAGEYPDIYTAGGAGVSLTL
ncbi:MAG: MBL fold metallo-hydrolase [Desulfosudaceae bacterium]